MKKLVTRPLAITQTLIGFVIHAEDGAQGGVRLHRIDDRGQTKLADDAVSEAFRLLDNFNIPVGVTGSRDSIARDIASATQVTTAADLKNRVLYFHTMDNRQVQKLDLKKIDFTKIQKQMIDQGAVRRQAMHELQVKL
jgi:choloylglycine hydrolase